MLKPGMKVFCTHSFTSSFGTVVRAGSTDEVVRADPDWVDLKLLGESVLASNWMSYSRVARGTFTCPTCGLGSTAFAGTSECRAPECLACILACSATCAGCLKFTRGFITVSSGATYCTPCSEKLFFSCSLCHQKLLKIEQVTDSCLTSLPFGLFSEEERPLTWCKDCLAAQVCRCARCNTHLRPANRYTMSGRSGVFCVSCLNAGVGIHCYSHKPLCIWHNLAAEKDGCYFGFELEIEHRTLNSGQLEKRACDLNGLKYVYCKSDSSVDNGFEIVSHPATWGWLKANRAFIEEKILSLRKEGFVSHDARSCGLHIHVTKKPLGGLTLQKLQVLIYGDPQFTLYVSRRTKDQLESYASAGAYPEARVVKASMMGQGYRGIRGALNLNPPKTVEFRLFRGTLKPDSFWRAFEFVRGSIMYCKDESLEKVGVLRFVKWVAEHRTEYPQLHKFFEVERPDDREVPLIGEASPVLVG